MRWDEGGELECVGMKGVCVGGGGRGGGGVVS